MRFEEAMGQQGITDPGMAAYTAEIKRLKQRQMQEKDPALKSKNTQEMQRLQKELEAKRKEQQLKLANMKKEIQQTQAVT